ncbi:hypothetical protein I6A60_06830 [Frankia sp. AgB1.9]|uniref:hypothetical protein n=1 Tax=unclassified Frankia TaxID=2632575 RepID=UPI0019313025|nr:MULTISPECIES: hypothetical protein [unclassified Frankia]MBL7492512.1 hypothetical protein [Frankia sp. AgW1.1]MBL7547587.1 hypothetical protein [Frankia sp. AgB1.9]MBL7619508.1 hypothetical protein [Frankia sp. AgB1.8]
MSSPPRTLLASLVTQRCLTVEEFCAAFADTATAIGAGTHGITDRQAKRWLAGTLVTRPFPAACRVLEAMFDQPAAALLGPPASTTASALTPVPRNADTYPGRAAPAPSQRPGHLSGKATLMAEDAEDTLRFLARAEDASPAEILDLLWSDVRRLARTYGDRLTFLAEDLVTARRAVFRLLEAPNSPARSRDLYFLGGVVCAMLAHTSRDLGQHDSTQAYQRSALLCADRAGHDGLRLFVRTEQAATAYWAGQHTASAHLAQQAADEARTVRGSLAVLPAIQEARAWAAAGRAGLATAALTRASDLRDQITPDDLDDLGGILALPLPEQLGIAAGTAAWLPDAAGAERAAQHALTAYETAPPAERSYNSEAIARADLALARVRGAALDGAIDAIAPVLAIPPERRVHQIRASVTRVSHALSGPRFRGSATARDTVAAVEAFTGERPEAVPPGLTATDKP